jgi:hypothetical protein
MDVFIYFTVDFYHFSQQTELARILLLDKLVFRLIGAETGHNILPLLDRILMSCDKLIPLANLKDLLALCGDFYYIID